MNVHCIFLSIILALSISCSDEVQNKSDEKKLNEPVLYPISVDHKYGYIDKTGKIVIEPQFDYALPFKEGLAIVVVGEKWGIYRYRGRICY